MEVLCSKRYLPTKLHGVSLPRPHYLHTTII